MSTGGTAQQKTLCNPLWRGVEALGWELFRASVSDPVEVPYLMPYLLACEAASDEKGVIYVCILCMARQLNAAVQNAGLLRRWAGR
ncbi:uncharacterized protein Bfra_002639 [Botrytis fragariae]|uniref:Uncharacterized protein n=1 Tax=Botrytis fragariae TaxID=1964551 RepID=A0A8H6AZ98_9HELO|nr:uncharacterized protein Bfra_002639 [Botrytis fragariae]KAF5876237.1 hypothetical protein Bfra_002639 [Botrytis fragariae]